MDKGKGNKKIWRFFEYEKDMKIEDNEKTSFIYLLGSCPSIYFDNKAVSFKVPCDILTGYFMV